MSTIFPADLSSATPQSPNSPASNPMHVHGSSVATTSSMRRILQTLSISALLLAFAPAAHAQISFDYRLGTPPPAPRAYRVPPQPGPDYVWIDGYWYPVNGQYRWHDGYWTRPPYADAYWVAPYYRGRPVLHRSLGRPPRRCPSRPWLGPEPDSEMSAGATRKKTRAVRRGVLPEGPTRLRVI